MYDIKAAGTYKLLSFWFLTATNAGYGRFTVNLSSLPVRI